MINPPGVTRHPSELPPETPPLRPASNSYKGTPVWSAHSRWLRPLALILHPTPVSQLEENQIRTGIV
jgi:hypothetical protein